MLPFFDATNRRSKGQPSVNPKTLRCICLLLLLDIPAVCTLKLTKVEQHPKGALKRRLVLAKACVATVSLLTGYAQVSTARNLPEASNVSTLSKTGTMETLFPIVRMKQTLSHFYAEFKQKEDAVTSTILEEWLNDTFLKEIPTDEKSFKAIFDAYSDPVSYKQKFVDQNAFLVYYSRGFDGPGRPNIENDLPVKQTLQYGARNEAWVAWDAFLAEARYAMNHPSEKVDTIELVQQLTSLIAAIDYYLAQAPREDTERALSTD